MNRMSVSAIALSFALTPAFAQDQTTDTSNMMRVSNVEDAQIYTLNTEWTDDEWLNATYDAVDSAWEQIGEAEDVVISTDGEVLGIIAEVGGFLDIGDADVLLKSQDYKLVPTGDEYAIVIRHSEEGLESMETVDVDWLD